MPSQRTDNQDALQEEEALALEMPMLRSCISTGSMGKRQVSFHKIEFRNYERTVGDNVASCGVPVSLGWEYDSGGELDLESYEKHRPPSRTREEMKLPSHVRMDLLKHAGYSLKDRTEAIKKSNIERNRRRATAAKTEEITRAEYALEIAGRSLKKVLNPKITKSKSKNKEEIAVLIRRDRLRSNRSAQLRRINSCPTMALSPNDLLDGGNETSELEQLMKRASAPLTPSTTATVDTAPGDQDEWFVGDESS